MNFKHDLLLIDIEATGLDVNKNEIIQLAGVLLDKKTLKEKEAFSSFVKPSKWKTRDPESMAVNKISYSQVANAPSMKAVLQKFNKVFGKDVVLSYYSGVMDIVFMQEAYKRARMKWPFDYHYFNIWGLFYAYLAKNNGLVAGKYFTGFGLKTLLKRFKIKQSENLHDALVDCRAEAEVLRKVVKAL